MNHILFSMALLVTTCLLLPTPHGSADELASANGLPKLRLLEDGQKLDDHRLKPLKDLDGYFPFTVPKTPKDWRSRARFLKQRTLVAASLWPMPERTPLNAVVHGRIERDGFTVEKVYFESVPGFFVTGQLFRPVGKKGPFPAVLCPHGHGGRLMDTGDKIREQIVRGAERFEASGRFPKLARCAQLARMGCVVLIVDMLGFADNMQLSHDLVHQFAKQRPEMENPNHWGLYTTQAELRCQTILGLQTWNNIRSLDFLCSLPDVDPSRLGVTGGSGGGTQTILLGIVDPRPTVLFPQGMVSTSMQGGCTCENCCLLRIGSGNVELAALFAPKPQAMTAADDWTQEMMTRGFPELQELYAMLGAKGNVQCTPYLNFDHNYNYVTRARMYEWFNRHLRLGLDEPIVEEDYPLLSLEETTVWDAEHPRPTRQGEDFERELLAYLTDRSDRQMAAIDPADESNFREIIGEAVKAIIGRTLNEIGPIQQTQVAEIDCKTYRLTKQRLTVSQHNEQVLAISLFPRQTEWNRQVVIWLTEKGKQGLFDDDASPIPAVAKLLASGFSIVTADLFGQGEAAIEVEATRGTTVKNRVVPNPRESAGYTYGYNTPLFSQRVHDVLSLLQWVQTKEKGTQAIQLVGTGSAGVVALAAGAVVEKSIDALAVELGGFRFRQLRNFRDPRFLPGIVKYGDVSALLALNASRKVYISDPKPELASQAFAASGGTLTWTTSGDANAAIVAWLID